MLEPDTARIVVSCNDRHGIVAALSGYLAEAGANIVSSNQYSTDPEGGSFFLRMEFHLAGLDSDRPTLEQGLVAIAERFEMRWRLV
jgi:formyltetrahydrofolate deformylase